MKILIATKSYLFNIIGGGDIQANRTYTNLKKNGIDIRFLDSKTKNIKDFDILHIFAPSVFPMDSYAIAKYAHNSGLKVVTSSVFWLPVYKTRMFNMLRINPINKIAIWAGNSIPMYGPTYLKLLFEKSDRVLPNTNDEKNMIKEVFDISHNKFTVIPNGVDKEFANGNKNLFNYKYDTNDFILFVGRIERRKNLLKLIHAFKLSELDTDLVIIGSIAESDYYEMCKNAANKKVKFIGSLDHDSDMLKSAYKAAKVVVLPSYYETPGLTALEGGLAGANIAITNIGGTKEYFEKFVEYINPYSTLSIKNAIISAYNRPKNKQLQAHILKNFTWDEVAKKTIKTYRKVL